jgi:hypothetical protein
VGEWVKRKTKTIGPAVSVSTLDLASRSPPFAVSPTRPFVAITPLPLFYYRAQSFLSWAFLH